MKNNISISSLGTYIDILNSINSNDDLYNKFKTLPEYIAILEHASYRQGLAYLNEIKLHTPQLIPMLTNFAVNDSIGQAQTYAYIDGINISPSTLRYIKVLSDIITWINNDWTDKDIVEIGGGYGGQCLIFSLLFKFKSYTIIDLPEALRLTSKYLHAHNISNVNYVACADVSKINADLVISNYAFTECSKEVQDSYVINIISNCHRGYITANFISHDFGIYSYTLAELLQLNRNSKAYAEIPLTHPSNTIITW